MRCISPLTIRQNGVLNTVPCGRCNFCLQTRRSDWTFRLSQEQKRSLNAHFVTLTYSDENIPDHGGVEKSHVQNLMKRLRKLNPIQLRYYLVSEYGTETHRPHYHIILFNLVPQLVPQLTQIWGLGHVYLGTVETGSIHYVTKYHVNRYGDHQGRPPPFCLMSRRPGIGANYLTTHTKWHRADFRNYAQVNGIISRLPRCYKEKMFSKSEREALAKISLMAGDVALLDTYDRLSAFHSDPYRYYDERVQAAHDAIIHKCNTQNLF